MPLVDPLHFIARLEADERLFRPEDLCRRFEMLDWLDTTFPNLGARVSDPACTDPGSAAEIERAEKLRLRLEEANTAVYGSIRSQIRKGSSEKGLVEWLKRCGMRKGTVPSGLGYDHLDELVSGVLALEEPAGAAASREPGMVFYQPTPVRHILRMIRVSRIAPEDVLLDLGSGLGHVPLLTSMLTGARAIGVEVEQRYVAAARACARTLRLRGVRFIHEDARKVDLRVGTVYFLYTPFTGAMLECVVRRLRRESDRRAIRVCTFGPCTLDFAKEAWLRPTTRPVADRATCFLPVR